MTIFIPCVELKTGTSRVQQDVQLLIQPATIEGKPYSLVTFAGQPKQ